MKYALLLLAAVSIDGLASEVGASNPQLASPATTNLAVAIAESGTSTRWAVQSTEEQASRKEIREFEKLVEGLGEKVDQGLNTTVYTRLEQILESTLY